MTNEPPTQRFDKMAKYNQVPSWASKNIMGFSVLSEPQGVILWCLL